MIVRLFVTFSLQRLSVFRRKQSGSRTSTNPGWKSWLELTRLQMSLPAARVMRPCFSYCLIFWNSSNYVRNLWAGNYRLILNLLGFLVWKWAFLHCLTRFPLLNVLPQNCNLCLPKIFIIFLRNFSLPLCQCTVIQI